MCNGSESDFFANFEGLLACDHVKPMDLSEAHLTLKESLRKEVSRDHPHRIFVRPNRGDGHCDERVAVSVVFVLVLLETDDRRVRRAPAEYKSQKAGWRRLESKKESGTTYHL